ncbi:zf-CCHC domain-containing protein [Cephalotus follicularis]|uniref:Zf-CCHC domain-containing protein n=1 Tax=Cephalotus follicularis TaxID=3775 RepID=A0A1Q3CMQ5_CEPFO|nr:zf-CCHC domain-containing protein [Cephalotus follicularis]
MTVVEYQDRFMELARHSPYLVADEVRKIRRFLRGLQPDLRLRIRAMELGTFSEVAQKARLLESISSKDRAERAQAQQNKQSPPRPASSKWQGSGSPTKSSKNRSGQTATQGTPSRGSNAGTGACYHCGRKGHLQKDCWRMNGLCLRCGHLAIP